MNPLRSSGSAGMGLSRQQHLHSASTGPGVRVRTQRAVGYEGACGPLVGIYEGRACVCVCVISRGYGGGEGGQEEGGDE